jgi:hypothetical protein
VSKWNPLKDFSVSLCGSAVTTEFVLEIFAETKKNDFACWAIFNLCHFIFGTALSDWH